MLQQVARRRTSVALRCVAHRLDHKVRTAAVCTYFFATSAIQCQPWQVLGSPGASLRLVHTACSVLGSVVSPVRLRRSHAGMRLATEWPSTSSTGGRARPIGRSGCLAAARRSDTARYPIDIPRETDPTRRRIPHDAVSHPTRRGIPRGAVSHRASDHLVASSPLADQMRATPAQRSSRPTNRSGTCLCHTPTSTSLNHTCVGKLSKRAPCHAGVQRRHADCFEALDEGALVVQSLKRVARGFVGSESSTPANANGQANPRRSSRQA
jgi:hypothetical protein